MPKCTQKCGVLLYEERQWQMWCCCDRSAGHKGEHKCPHRVWEYGRKP